jgi:hypothetical protein
MKTLIKFLALFLVPLASCVSPQYTSRTNDDVYSFGEKTQGMTPVVVVKEPAKAAPAPPTQYTEPVNEPQDSTYGEALIDDNYYYEDNFKYDDYYDYSYASRIRRFDNPLYGAGYYDSYYTNEYWYNYNPYAWGTSIYIGYDYRYAYPFNGFYYYNSPYFGYSRFSSYYPYNNFWYANYYNPYYGYNYWSPYNYGYNYYNSYWNGFYDGAFYGSNPYDINSRYYGPRNHSTANLGRSRSTVSNPNIKRQGQITTATNRSSSTSNLGSRTASTRSAKRVSGNRGYFSNQQVSDLKKDHNRNSSQSRVITVGASSARESSRGSSNNSQNAYRKTRETNPTNNSHYSFDRAKTNTTTQSRYIRSTGKINSRSTLSSPGNRRTSQYNTPSNTNIKSSREYSTSRSYTPRYQRPSGLKSNTQIRSSNYKGSSKSSSTVRRPATYRTIKRSGSSSSSSRSNSGSSYRSSSSSSRSNSGSSYRSSSSSSRSSGSSFRSSSSSGRSSGGSRSSGGTSIRR